MLVKGRKRGILYNNIDDENVDNNDDDKDKDAVLPSNEYEEFGYRGSYTHANTHSTFMQTIPKITIDRTTCQCGRAFKERKHVLMS